MNKPGLSFTRTDAFGCWVDSEGPVWPVRNAHEEDALRRIARTYGAEIRAADTVEQRVLEGPSVVAAWSEKLSERARLYAHLTGRRAVVVERVEDLRCLSNLEVVVLFEADVTFELLSALYDKPQGVKAPGLVFASSLAQLDLQVLIRSAAARLSGPLTTRRVDMLTSLDLTALEGKPGFAGQMFLSAASTADKIRDGLGRGAGVLLLQTHSDGLDAFLRPGLGLCSVATSRMSTSGDRLPACVQSGHCRHYDQSIQEAQRTGKLVGPEDLAARVFIFDACWGLMPSPSLTDRAWSFTRAVIEAGQVGAIMTPWEIVISKPSSPALLADSIADGEPVGRALLAHLQREPSDVMCLIGDPDVRLPALCEPQVGLAAVLDAIEIHKREVDESLKSSRAKQMRNLSFARAYVRSARSIGSDLFIDRTEPSLAALDHYEDVLLAGGVLEGPAEAPGPLAREAVLRSFAGRSTLAFSIWSAWLDHWEVLPDRTSCWACNNPTRLVHCHLRGFDDVARSARLCPACGNIEDLPAGRSLHFTTDEDRVLRLSGSIDQPGTRAIAVVEDKTGRHPRVDSRMWPNDEQGRLASTLRWEGEIADGNLRFAIGVMWPDMSFGIVARLVRGEHCFGSR